ncbi:tellurite resistance TerB family protein [Hydrogenovibrio halophilus]|uniref:tellurite resistance TerB family protein n=1 Tax=Hydrogenovibrio halophilus TaxID=373391 RepID=UPI000368930B|nr:TerB family tellurite resistance protein [Hydrogenovibrio halophilus]
MFLQNLSLIEKKSFLAIAHHIARSDGDFSEKQKMIISQYCDEMLVSNVDFDESTFNLDSELSKVKSPESQKIMLLELMALVYSDDQLHESEKEVIDAMVKDFNLSEEVINIYAQWGKSMIALMSQANSLIKL